MPVIRAGIVGCAFAVLAGILAALRGASAWLAVACAVGTAAIVMAVWFGFGGRLGSRSPSPGLSSRTDKAVERICAHAREHHPAGSRRRVRELTDPIQDAVDGLVELAANDPGGDSILSQAAAYVVRLEKLEVHDREIDPILGDLKSILTSLERIKPKQPNRSAP